MFPVLLTNTCLCLYATLQGVAVLWFKTVVSSEECDWAVAANLVNFTIFIFAEVIMWLYAAPTSLCKGLTSLGCTTDNLKLCFSEMCRKLLIVLYVCVKLMFTLSHLV